MVLFLVDDMGWVDGTPYGSQYYETPQIERLAKQSMRFTDACAVPLCSPTGASILTGHFGFLSPFPLLPPVQTPLLPLV